jgi:hypothetical protein
MHGECQYGRKYVTRNSILMSMTGPVKVVEIELIDLMRHGQVVGTMVLNKNEYEEDLDGNRIL